MKINLIPSKKLALLSAAFCAAMLAFSHNASAVTNLTIGDGHELGDVSPAGPNPNFNDANKTIFLNDMIGLALGGSQSVDLGGTPYLVQRSFNFFGPLPGPAVIGPSGTNTTITIGSGLYSYLFATYTRGGPVVGEVWYIGNLSGVSRFLSCKVISFLSGGRCLAQAALFPMVAPLRCCSGRPSVRLVWRGGS